MTDNKDHNLIELIKDLECIAGFGQETLERSSKYNSESSIFEAYREGYLEGITLASRLGRHYLKND